MSNSKDLQAQFQQWRQELYNCFQRRPDTLMDLLDSLSSNVNARSPAELSLNSLFRRDYSALYKATENFFLPSSSKAAVLERQKLEGKLFEKITKVVPLPKRPFHLFALDATPVPRPYAQTLADRTFIYQPNTIRGNKPVNIGHSYSILSVLPERIGVDNAPWTIPLTAQRIGSTLDTPRPKGTGILGSTSLR